MSDVEAGVGFHVAVTALGVLIRADPQQYGPLVTHSDWGRVSHQRDTHSDWGRDSHQRHDRPSSPEAGLTGKRR